MPSKNRRRLGSRVAAACPTELFRLGSPGWRHFFIFLFIVFSTCTLASKLARRYLRVRRRDVFVQALVMVYGVFQVLQLGGQIHLAACFAPGVHVAHVLREKKHMFPVSSGCEAFQVRCTASLRPPPPPFPKVMYYSRHALQRAHICLRGILGSESQSKRFGMLSEKLI